MQGVSRGEVSFQQKGYSWPTSSFPSPSPAPVWVSESLAAGLSCTTWALPPSLILSIPDTLFPLRPTSKTAHTGCSLSCDLVQATPPLCLSQHHLNKKTGILNNKALHRVPKLKFKSQSRGSTCSVQPCGSPQTHRETAPVGYRQDTPHHRGLECSSSLRPLLPPKTYLKPKLLLL